MAKIKNILGEKEPDYLIVQHMEPDHSANVARFIDEFPNAKIVTNTKSEAMATQFFDRDFTGKFHIVNDGDILNTGKHSFTFIFAPMVHWPEVMLSYENTTKTLFTADAFGKFGTFNSKETWEDESARYYFGIVAKYSAQVQALLKKASALEIETICSAHGPILNENLSYYIDLYDKWSSNTATNKGIVIAYTSIYSNTKNAVELLASELERISDIEIKIYDLSRCDIFKVIADAFRYENLVLATTTYNGDIFPNMKHFIDHLVLRGYQNKKIALIENGTWAPMANKVMRTYLEKCKNITYAENSVTIKSALNFDSKNSVIALAKELASN